MEPSRSRVAVRIGTSICSFLLAAQAIVGQTGARSGEWPTYGGDLGNTRYSPLDQINRDNFNNLEIAWRFKTDNLGPRPEFNFQSTPLMVKGRLYSTAGSRRAVVALDAATGEMIWMHSQHEGERGEKAPRQLSGRGLAYWSDGTDERILYVTPGYRLAALDAKTGAPVPEFGKDGIVDLKRDFDQEIDPIDSDVGLHAAPIVAGNTIIIGAAHRVSFVPRSKTNVKGYIRGYDVRTGERLWIFHTIPRPGEFGSETWEDKESLSYTGNTGVWAQMSVDEELGLAYLPVESPTGDLYGGHRPGAGLFGESLVAVDLKTGKRRWHYQLVHHGIWDWDIPCAPILVDLTIGGKRVKAVVQPTKQAWVFVFDRATGVPLWPIEERPVPQSDVPLEKTSPTQPVPLKPPPFDRQGVSIDDLIDFTPELRAEAVKLVSRYKLGPIYTPPVLSRWEGPYATLVLPNNNGGPNWPGGAVDPETGILYIYSWTQAAAHALIRDPERSDMEYIRGFAAPPATDGDRGTVPLIAGGGARAQSGGRRGGRGGGGDGEGEGGGGGAARLLVQGLPLIKPPYGRISAIDLNAGEIVWQVPHGETPDAVRNHPALKGLNVPRTGRPSGRIGTLVTRTLVIAGEPGFVTTPSGERGAMLRAYDKATGADIGAVYMPAPQTGSPMTYMLNGEQYIVVAISGGSYSGELLAFKLPAETAVRVTSQRSLWAGAYSSAQARRGAALYAAQCASCHGLLMEGNGPASALVGPGFTANWDGRSLAELADRTRLTMPVNKPGSLSRQEVADLLAYVLETNRFPAGEGDLPSQAEALRQIRYLATRP
jgi:quinoprotein glucose dehydrogenase